VLKLAAREQVASDIAAISPACRAAAGTGIQLKVNQFDVAANFEPELFTYRKLGNAGDMYVWRIETSMRPFSHHSVLYMFDPNTPAFVIPQPDSIRDIREPDGSMIGLNMIAMGYRVFLAGTMTQQSNYAFLAGMALQLTSTTRIEPCARPPFLRVVRFVCFGPM
jgi:hypothetical protein